LLFQQRYTSHGNARSNPSRSQSASAPVVNQGTTGLLENAQGRLCVTHTHCLFHVIRSLQQALYGVKILQSERV
jgi:hypothetical protein